MSTLFSKMGRAGLAALAIGGLVLLAAAFVALGISVLLARLVPPGAAALITAAILFAAAAAVYLIVAKRSAGVLRHPQDTASESCADIETILDRRVGGGISSLLRKHPEGAVVASLLIGVTAGYNRSAREVLDALCRDYLAQSSSHDSPEDR